MPRTTCGYVRVNPYPYKHCHTRFLLAVVVAAMGVSSAAEARHWGHHWHYQHDFYQETNNSRGEENARRTFAKYRSHIEADEFGRVIKQMLGACAQQAVELKRM